jgi:hypothetical protein
MTFKKINPQAIIYHYLELTPTKIALYDDDFEEPIMQGSRNLVDATVRKLDKKVMVIYYKRDTDKFSFKKKFVYEGKKTANNNISTSQAKPQK